MPTPAPAAPSHKICVVCGEDCSGRPRVKDPQGRYFCKACQPAAPSPKVVVKAAAAAVSVASTPGEGFDLAGFTEPDAAPVAVTATQCPTCGRAAAPGQAICIGCGHNFKSGKQLKSKVGRPQGGGSDAAAAVANSSAALVGMIIGGSIAGAIGAGIWAFIALQTGYEVAYVAWGIGALVGFGTAIGARGSAGAVSGAVATAIAIASLIGGKCWTIAAIMSQRHLTGVSVFDVLPQTLQPLDILFFLLAISTAWRLGVGGSLKRGK